MRYMPLFLVLILLCGWAPLQSRPEDSDQARALLPEFQSDLSQSADWDRYTITATVDPQRQSLVGSTTLRYTNRDTKSLDLLYFRLFPNLKDFAGRIDISSVRVDGKAAKFKLERGRYLLRIQLAQRLAVTATTEVLIAFSTKVPANAGHRFYGAFNLQNSVLALASAYPLVAMVHDGIWDTATPDTRGDLVNSPTALYDVSLTAPVDWNLATTGAPIERQVKARTQIVRFVSGPQRDFMIVATKLAAVRGNVDGTQVISYYRAGDEAGGRAALDIAMRAINIYNTHFGHYPLTEFELVPVDAGTFLGVEYPGITLIEQRLYRNNPRQLETIISHEVAHQWWYSLVGNNVQTEAWLDEALATYSQVIYAEEIGGADAGSAQLEEFRKSYRAVRTAKRDTAVAQPNQHIRGYYTIVYAKGALFFHALRRQIGEEDFSRFLKNYYADHRYGIAAGADLLASAEHACSCQLDGLYQDWIQSSAPVAIP